MSYLPRSGEKRKSVCEYDPNDDRSVDMDTSPGSPKHPMDNEKRLRREIANSNERRRMQSINAGFQSLKTLIPHHREEKLSKAAILQQTSEYIVNLESEKSRLLSQNAILRQVLKELNHNPDSLVGPITEQITPPPKRKKRDTESSDEGISMGYDDVQMDELKKEVHELRLQLDRERKLRQVLEERQQPQQQQQQPQQQQRHCVKEEPRNEKCAAVTKLKEEESLTTTTTTRLPEAAAPRMPVFATSMSKRNLETIVEAIRHLEGEHILGDPDRHIAPAHSEESQPDSSSDDTDDLKSESSGRDSPPPPHRWPLTAVSS